MTPDGTAGEMKRTDIKKALGDYFRRLISCKA